MAKQSSFTAEEAIRLDAFLAEKLGETRNQVAQLIKQGAITVDAKATSKPGLKLKPEQIVHVTFPEVEQKEAQPID